MYVYTHQLCASFLFLFCPIFIFLLFRSIYLDVGATTGVFLLFPNGFLLCDHGLDFWDRLMMREFSQSIMLVSVYGMFSTRKRLVDSHPFNQGSMERQWEKGSSNGGLALMLDAFMRHCLDVMFLLSLTTYRILGGCRGLFTCGNH